MLETSKLDSLSKFVSEKYYLLTLPIKELDDARRVILCSEEIESHLTELDENIENTNSVYDLLNEFNVDILPKDEIKLNVLADTYRKLIVKVFNVLIPHCIFLITCDFLEQRSATKTVRYIHATPN